MRALCQSAEALSVTPNGASREAPRHHLRRQVLGEAGGEPGVHVAPAEGGVVDGGRRAIEALARLRHREGGAGHALHAAGHGALGLAGGDHPRRVAHGLEAGAAEAVHRHRGHLVGQVGEERGHAGHVAVVFSGLVGGAEDHLIDAGHQRGHAAHQGLDHQGGEVVGPDGGEASGVLADGGADSVDDVDGAAHGGGLYHQPPPRKRA